MIKVDIPRITKRFLLGYLTRTPVAAMCRELTLEEAQSLRRYLFDVYLYWTLPVTFAAGLEESGRDWWMCTVRPELAKHINKLKREGAWSNRNGSHSQT